MSLLLLDLGNSRLKLAALDGAAQEPLALPHADAGFAQALAAALQRWPQARTALLASVAPPALAADVVAVLARAGVATTQVAVAARPELSLCYPEPARFGVDRWLALLAARRLYPDAPLLLAACGTALTLDLVDADGGHQGGMIAPAPALMLEALQRRAPHLPQTLPADHGFACDSAPAMASGALLAAAGLLREARRRAAALLGRPPALLLTGGGAPELLPLLDADAAAPASYHPWLVLDGLAILARDGAAGPG